MIVPEAQLEQTAEGLRPVGPGWFVLNAREARWRHRKGGGDRVSLTGTTAEECETFFRGLGANLSVLGPGEPIGMYHWEADQEAFLVLSGEALLLIEGQERSLRQWDFVHLPAGTRHMIVGTGEGCTVLAIGAREHIDESCNGGAYVVDDVALRHGAGVEEETTEASIAYARYPDSEPMSYRDGSLPDR
jgi:uncharacterized cupin superfamily protein